MYSEDCGKSFLKNTQSQVAWRIVYKTGVMGSYGTVACCTDAGSG